MKVVCNTVCTGSLNLAEVVSNHIGQKVDVNVKVTHMLRDGVVGSKYQVRDIVTEFSYELKDDPSVSGILSVEEVEELLAKECLNSNVRVKQFTFYFNSPIGLKESHLYPSNEIMYDVEFQGTPI